MASAATKEVARKVLEAVPEGNGTMLDHTTVVYLSDAAEGHHSRCWEWPFVVIAGRNTARPLFSRMMS